MQKFPGTPGLPNVPHILMGQFGPQTRKMFETIELIENLHFFQIRNRVNFCQTPFRSVTQTDHKECGIRGSWAARKFLRFLELCIL